MTVAIVSNDFHIWLLLCLVTGAATSNVICYSRISMTHTGAFLLWHKLHPFFFINDILKPFLAIAAIQISRVIKRFHEPADGMRAFSSHLDWGLEWTMTGLAFVFDMR